MLIAKGRERCCHQQFVDIICAHSLIGKYENMQIHVRKRRIRLKNNPVFKLSTLLTNIYYKSKYLVKLEPKLPHSEITSYSI